jgi:hypothetical protein
LNGESYQSVQLTYNLELLARLFQARLVKGTSPESREQKQMAGAHATAAGADMKKFDGEFASAKVRPLQLEPIRVRCSTSF